VTSYFEWLSAGFATPSGGGSMHRTVRHLEKVYFGYDAARFYARMDFAGGLPKLPAGVSVRMHIIGPREITLTMDRHPDRWLCTPGGPLPPEQAPAVAGVKILEIGIPLEALGITEPDEVRFFFTLHDDGRELERFPSTGFLVVPLDPWGLDQQEWMV
jgi:hypothetical protein